MNIKVFILILFAGSFFLNACQKNTDFFVPDPGQLIGADTNWHSTVTAAMPVSVLKNNLLLEPYQDTITVNASIASIATPFGMQLNFPPNSCVTSAGQIVTGKVQVELQVVKKKGDMIRLNKPSTFNDSLMTTAGEIFIRLKKEEQILQLAPNVSINIRYIDLPTNPLMNFFIGDETNAERFNWLPTPTPFIDTIIITPQAYELYTKRLRWISIARLYDAGNNTARVNVTADMASHFTNANTVAFTVFKNFNSVVNMHADVSSRKFISGRLPVGKQITVVVITKIGSDYYLGYESATTQIPALGSLLQHVRVVPIKKSLSEILFYLSSL